MIGKQIFYHPVHIINITYSMLVEVWMSAHEWGNTFNHIHVINTAVHIYFLLQ